MRNTIRVIGGPAHGRVETAPDGSGVKHLRIAIPHYASFAAYDYMSNYSPLDTRSMYFEYESRKIMLGPLTAVEVLCPPQMSDNELMRRLADIIDGTRLER